MSGPKERGRVSFRFTRLEVPDVILIEPTVFEDARGCFLETYKRGEFLAAGIPDVFVQDNYSHSVYRVLRGLHYQKPPHAQGKLIAAIGGEIFDVAVDIRPGSRTYGRWTSTTLSETNRRLLYIPPGFAHGFCVCSAHAHVIYKVTAEYAPDFEHGIAWNDPDLAIPWPIDDPIVSAKDARLGPFRRVTDHATARGG
jgi:dTDP-4-dehydrorhamnose 3,5-epimerase